MKGLRSRLDRVWRMLMTGLCFALFGLGGLTLSLVWFNLLLIFQRDRTQRRRLARRTISASFRLFLAVVRGVGVLDYRFNNLDVLRAERGCLVKSALLRNPFVSGVIRAADYLINSEADTLLTASQQRLAQGDTLLIFPEGTRTRVGEAITLQRGAANITVRCNSAVRVVVIHCSERMLDKQSSWYNVPPNKPVFTVDVRERINIHDFYDASQHEPALAARQLNRHMQHQLTTGLQSLSGTKDASALS